MNRGKTVTEETEDAPLQFGKTRRCQYPSCVTSWEENQDVLSAFYEYPSEIRKIIYTTNIIEGLNRQFRYMLADRAAGCALSLRIFRRAYRPDRRDDKLGRASAYTSVLFPPHRLLTLTNLAYTEFHGVPYAFTTTPNLESPYPQNRCLHPLRCGTSCRNATRFPFSSGVSPSHASCPRFWSNWVR